MTTIKKKSKLLTDVLLSSLILLLTFNSSFAKDTDFPPRPNPPRLVNDLAQMMTPGQQQNLEQRLEAIAKRTSTQITIVTINNLGSYAPSRYVTKLGNLWGIGQKQKDNGVIIFVAKENHKINISPGYGLEGALPDITCKHIIENEITPAFRKGDFYMGFSNAANAVIEATKGEYKATNKRARMNRKGGFNVGGIIALLVIIFVIIMLIRRGGNNNGRGGGRRGGHYMSGVGGGFLTGALLGGMLGGGMGRGFGGGFGGGGLGSGGFGGFGGGGFGGGGASGGW